jgi:hypothetical protein
VGESPGRLMRSRPADLPQGHSRWPTAGDVSGLRATNPLVLQRSGRHLYDIWRLLSADSVVVALAQYPGGIAGLAEDVHRCSEAAGFPSVRRPAAGYAASPAFVNRQLAPVIRTAYRNIEPLVWGEMPSIEAVFAKVADSAARL